MIRQPPRSTRPYPLFPYTPLFRSPVFLAQRVIGRRRILRLQARVAGETARLGEGLRALRPELDPAPGLEAEALEINQRIEIAFDQDIGHRSEEHTSELQSLMRISYAVFCLKKKKITALVFHMCL